MSLVVSEAMTFYNPNHNSFKIHPKSNYVSCCQCWLYSFEGIRLHFSSTPTAHNKLAFTIVQIQNNGSVSKHGVINWRTSFFKRTQSEQDCTLLLYKVNLYFWKQSLKFSPQTTLSTCLHLIFTWMFVLCLPQTQIPTFLPFPHVYLITPSLIRI